MENKFTGFDSSILYRCNQKYYDKVLSKYELGYTQMLFLLKIYENEGQNMNDLATVGSFDKGTITKSLQKLEQLGYVDIVNSSFDKRSKLLYTSPKAKAIMPKLYLLRQEWQEYLSKDLDYKELETYMNVVEKLVVKAREYNLHESKSDVKIYGMQKLTLLDYPGKMAATLFTGGCNFRCPFCHNRSLVFLNEQDGEIDKDIIFDYLSLRKKMLDGVCITGGEPLLHEGIEDFIKSIKELGLLVKLDTNGSNFEKLEKLVSNKLVDYVAMDIKNVKSEYTRTIGLNDYDLSEVERCVDYLKQGHVDYEFRTTLVKEFHENVDFSEIGRWLNGAKNYYLQNFEDNETCIESGLHSLDINKIREIRDILKPYIENVSIRGLKEEI